MDVFVSRASRLRGLLCVLACVALLMGADRRVVRAPAATGELTLVGGTAGSFDAEVANAGLAGFSPVSVNDGVLGTTALVDGVLHYAAHADGSGVDRVAYQLVNAAGQRVLGELRVRVVEAQAAVPMRVMLATQDRAGVRVALHEGDTVLAEGTTRGNGTVDLVVPAGLPGEAMLSLHAEGVGAGGAALRWVSLLGSAQQLRAASAGERLEALDWPALRLGAASTAFHATLGAIDPQAAFNTDAALRAAPGVDTQRVLVGAALVDLIEAGVLPLPPGYADTLDLVMDDAEVDRLRALHWNAHVNAAIEARLMDPIRSARLPAAPYEAWFWPPHAHGLVLGEGSGLSLRAGGGGEYFARHELEDTGIAWHAHEGGLRVELNQPIVREDGGQGRWCELADGSLHSYLVLQNSRRGTLDLRRVHGFAGTDYIVKRWHRVQYEELYAPVPGDCEVELLPERTFYQLSHVLTQPNVDTVSVHGPPVAVPEQVLLGLGQSGSLLVAGLLDVQQQTLHLEGAALDIDVQLARAGRVVFDAVPEDGGAPVRFELQQLRAGLGDSSSWAVVRREADGTVRGWVSAGIMPQAVRADFDWNDHWIHVGSWSQQGTMGLWRTEQRWLFDAESERARRFGKTSPGGGWVEYPTLQRHFLVEDGAAVHRLYYTNTGSNLLTCPAGVACWRQSEHRLLPVAELRDVFGPGHDLVFVMHEYGVWESVQGWAQFQRFVDAWVRDPAGNLRRATPVRVAEGGRARNTSLQRH